jgi:hypothetical protein
MIKPLNGSGGQQEVSPLAIKQCLHLLALIFSCLFALNVFRGVDY